MSKRNVKLTLFENDDRPEVTIFTDGACKGNPGRGAWAAILLNGQTENSTKEIFGVAERTTNNQMELTAVIEALRALKRPCRATVYSDSAYLVNAFDQNWIDQWQRNGWRTKDRKDVKNRDLWEALIELCKTHEVTFRKVAGHSGHVHNERADFLANRALE